MHDSLGRPFFGNAVLGRQQALSVTGPDTDTGLPRTLEAPVTSMVHRLLHGERVAGTAGMLKHTSTPCCFIQQG